MSNDLLQFPTRIRIQRLENCQTHFCGRVLANGNLFLGAFVFDLVDSGETALGKLRYYAVLFEFCPRGTFLRSTHSTSEAPHLSGDELQKLVDSLGAVEYCDIEVELFETKIDGILFGLIPDPEFGFIQLQPGATIAFYPPWDGEYYT